MTRPVFKGPCRVCGDIVVDCDTLILFLCPQKPALKHLQYRCHHCGVTCRVDTILAPSTVTACGGRIVSLTWVDELDDPARRSKLGPFTSDDVIDWHQRVAETITLRDWERR